MDNKLLLENHMMNTIKKTIEAVGIIDTNKALIYHAVVSNYSINRTHGVIKYHIENYLYNKVTTNGEDSLLSIDRAYIKAFDQIRNIVEYEIPKMLCLFETLFSRAAYIKRV